MAGLSRVDEPLRARMILSNEPGYYKPGAYGIRIENLVGVVERQIEGAAGPVEYARGPSTAPASARS